MQLSEIFEVEGIKLLDSTVFHPNENVIEIIHDCNICKKIPLDLLILEATNLEMCNNYILNNDVYSIEEVAKEQEKFLDAIGESHSHHSNPKMLKFIKRSRNRPNRGVRIVNRYTEERRLAVLEQNEIIQDNIFYLDEIGKETNTLIKRIKRKDIRNTFSDLEINFYNQFLGYFMYVYERHVLINKRKNNKNLKSSEPCDFDTDEKLTAAAFTVANRCPDIIISSDSDIVKLIEFFDNDSKDKVAFNVKEPIYEINVYSNIENDFKVVGTYSRKYTSAIA